MDDKELEPTVSTTPKHSINADDILAQLELLMIMLDNAKPGDRSHIDRAYAIAKTDTEKLYAYFKQWIWDQAQAEFSAND